MAPKKNLTYQISQIDEDDKIFDEGSENANIKQFDEYYEGKTEDEEEQDDVYDEEEDDDDEEEVDNPAHQGSEEGCKATQPSEGSIEKEQTDKVDEKSREIINLLSTSKMEEKKNEQPVNHFLVEDHSNHRKDHLNPRKNISKEYQSDPVDCKVEMIKGGNDQHETHKLTILNIDKKLTDHEKKKIPSSFVDFNSGWSLPVSSHPPTIVGRITSDKLPDERKRNSDVYPHPPIHRSDEIDRTKEGEKEPTNFDTLSIFPNVEIFFKSYQKGKYNFYEKNFEENINLGNRWKKLSRTSLRTMLSDGICAEGEGTVGGSNSEVRYPHVELGNHYRKGDAGGHLTDGSSSYNSGVTSDYTYYYDIEHTSDYGNLYVKDFANGVTANSAFENERKKEQKDSIESYHRGYNSAILSETLCRNSSLSVASGIKEESFRRHKQNYVHAKEVLLKKVALLEGAGKMYSSSAYNSEKYFSHIHFAKIFNMVSEKKMNIKNFKILKNIYKYNLSKIFSNHYKYIIVKKKKKLRKFCYTLKHFDICKVDHFWFNIYCQNELKKIFFRNLHFIIDLHNTRIVDFKLINNYILHKIYENTTVSRLAPSTCYNIKIIDFFFRENLYLLNKSTMNDIIYKYIIFYYCRKKLRKKNFNYYNYQDMYIAENFFGQNTHTKKVPKILDEDLGKKSAIITVDR